MRTLILKDTKIDKDELLAVLDDFSDFFEEHTGIECTFWVEQHDFSSVPTVPDSDGDLKPTHEYRKALNKAVHARYGDYGADNVVMLVHEDNFLFKGIWGQNWSYVYHKHSFQLVRYDRDNKFNTLGTLYHEFMHSFDRLIKEETGFNIDPLFEGNWDKYVVHGGRPDEVGKYSWDYIKYQDNTDALRAIATHLKHAFDKRKEKHDKHMGLYKQIIKLLQLLISLLSKKAKV